MTIFKFAAAVALLAFSAGSLAAKPTSIVFGANAQTGEGIDYATYTVKCSNGKNNTSLCMVRRTFYYSQQSRCCTSQPQSTLWICRI